MVFDVFICVLSAISLLTLYYGFLRKPLHTVSWTLGLFGGVFYSHLALIWGVLTVFAVQKSLLWPVSLILFFTFIVAAFLKRQFWSRQGIKVSWLQTLKIPAFWSSHDQRISVEAVGDALVFLNENPQAPCVMTVFGSGFIGGGPNQLSHFHHELRKSGYHVVALPYRYLPKAKWPIPLEDVIKGVETTMGFQSADFKPQKFHMMGRSAGGFLTLLADTRVTDPRLEKVIAIYPVCSLGDWVQEEGGQKILNSSKIYNDLVQSPFRESDVDLRTKQFPKFRRHLIVTGDFDPFVEHRNSEWVRDLLIQQKVPVEYGLYPTESHGFDVSFDSFAGQVLKSQLLEFLRKP